MMAVTLPVPSWAEFAFANNIDGNNTFKHIDFQLLPNFITFY